MEFRADRAIYATEHLEHLELGAWSEGEDASGLRLKQPDMLSMLADMKEELSMMLSHFGRRQTQTERAEREQRLPFGKDIESILQTDAPQRIGRLHEAAAGDARMSAQSLLQFARGLFSDPSDLALALAELLRHWRLPEPARKRLEKARDLLLEQEGEQRIRSGINAAPKSRQYGKKLGLTPQGLREAYRSFVTGDYPEVAQYTYLLEAFGFEQRHRAIDFLQEILALDISAANPSCSHQEFGRLLDRLLTLRMIRSADITFLECVARRDGPPWSAAENQQLLQLMLHAVQNTEAVRQRVSEQLEELFRFSRRAVIARFIQQLMRGFREIPEQLYADPSIREELLSGLLELSGEICGYEHGTLRALHDGY